MSTKKIQKRIYMGGGLSTLIVLLTGILCFTFVSCSTHNMHNTKEKYITLLDSIDFNREENFDIVPCVLKSTEGKDSAILVLNKAEHDATFLHLVNGQLKIFKTIKLDPNNELFYRLNAV